MSHDASAPTTTVARLQSEGDKPKKGEITITYNGPNDVIISPDPGLLDRNHQKMTWNLVTNVPGVEFAVPGGITFPNPPPQHDPPYTPWPGDTPAGNATQYTADAKYKVPHGDPVQTYCYLIDLVTPDGGLRIAQVQRATTNEIIDPPIDNEPEP